MYTVLLSGGSGKRLWPLSNDLRSKQYIRLVNKEGVPEEKCSMVQRVWAQLEDTGLASTSIITASTGQVEIIQSQLGPVDIAVEPGRRDTFPAVAISCAYLKSKMGATNEDVVAILPVDPYTENTYFETIKGLEVLVQETNADIALMGVEPTYPSEKYGYIIPESVEHNHIKVKGFKEKPEESVAKELIQQKAIWNCGVFCFKIGMIEEKVKQYGLTLDYNEIYNNYEKLPKISFDYEVLEKANSLVATSFQGMWKDLGTWNTLTEQMKEETVGMSILHGPCSNTQVINELNIPVVTMGLKDAVVVASYDGILVADKSQSAYIKEATEKINLEPMYEERRWGTIKNIDYTDNGEEKTVTRKIKIFEGMTSSYHYHKNRKEIFTAINGEAELILEGVSIMLTQGKAVCIQANQRHAIRAITEFEYMETHVGTQVGNTDFERITFNWNDIDIAVIN